MTVQPGYEELAEVLQRALDQAQLGKGAVRHAQNHTFGDQPMQAIADLVGPGFMAGQAIKKVQESQRLEPDAAERELLGAIVYCAGLIIHRRGERTARYPWPTEAEVAE